MTTPKTLPKTKIPRSHIEACEGLFCGHKDFTVIFLWECYLLSGPDQEHQTGV